MSTPGIEDGRRGRSLWEDKAESERAVDSPGSGSLVDERVVDRTWDSWDDRLGRCFQCLEELRGVLFGLTGKNMAGSREIVAARGGSRQAGAR